MESYRQRPFLTLQACNGDSTRGTINQDLWRLHHRTCSVLLSRLGWQLLCSKIHCRWLRLGYNNPAAPPSCSVSTNFLFGYRHRRSVQHCITVYSTIVLQSSVILYTTKKIVSLSISFSGICQLATAVYTHVYSSGHTFPSFFCIPFPTILNTHLHLHLASLLAGTGSCLKHSYRRICTAAIIVIRNQQQHQPKATLYSVQNVSRNVPSRLPCTIHTSSLRLLTRLEKRGKLRITSIYSCSSSKFFTIECTSLCSTQSLPYNQILHTCAISLL